MAHDTFTFTENLSASLQTCVYRVLRYTPNLVRDEWINIGVLLLDAQGRRARVRLMEDASEFARLRRWHPRADEETLRALQADLERQLQAQQDPRAYVNKLDDTLSNVLQLSPQRAVLTQDFDLELDRLFRTYVEAPRYQGRAAAGENSRHGIRARVSEVFRSAGIWAKTERGIRVEDYTHRGDPLRLDFAYQRNGTRGFVHALALGRDPAQAKILAFTAERIRARLRSEFTAVTETEPRPENDRHAFISGLLAEQQVRVVPLAGLPEFATKLRVELR